MNCLDGEDGLKPIRLAKVYGMVSDILAFKVGSKMFFLVTKRCYEEMTYPEPGRWQTYR